MTDQFKPCPFCGSDPVNPEAVIDGMICCGNADCIAWTFPATIERWNTRPLEDALLEACERALEHLDCASFDYSNGNTDSTGMIDEGTVYGTRSHIETTTQLLAAIAKARRDVKYD